MSIVARLGREARAAFELWLVPFFVAAMPYRFGIRAARFIARALPIYAATSDAAVHAFASLVPGVDEARWRAEHRFHVLLDHADLYWVLLRSPRFFDRLLRNPPALPAITDPLIALAFHYGQGMALMRWLTAAGRPPRFVSIRLSRGDAESSTAYAYARLRNRAVERLTGRPLILTGGARREIASALDGRTTVLGLVDVPLVDAASHPANARLLDHPVVLPAGLIESLIPGTRVLVVSARVDDDGLRRIEGREVDASELSMAMLADELSQRLVEAPAAWHFWHLWPRFLAAAQPSPPADGAAAPTHAR